MVFGGPFQPQPFCDSVTDTAVVSVPPVPFDRRMWWSVNEKQTVSENTLLRVKNTLVCLLRLPHLLIWSCAAKSASSAARRRSRSSSSCSSKYFISCFVLLCKCSVSDNLSENNKAYAKKGLIHGLLWFYCIHWYAVCEQTQITSQLTQET